jgi:hypothetical protein
MKQIHVWPNHVHIADLDLVLVVPAGESRSQTLGSLAKLGFDTDPDNVEFHDPELGSSGAA